MYFHEVHTGTPAVVLSRSVAKGTYNEVWESLRYMPHIFIPDEDKSDVEMINYLMEAYGLYKRPSDVLLAPQELWVSYEGEYDDDDEKIYYKIERADVGQRLIDIVTAIGSNNMPVKLMMESKRAKPEVTSVLIDGVWKYHVAFGNILSVNIRITRESIIVSSVGYLPDEQSKISILKEEDVVATFPPGLDLTVYVA